MIRIASFDNKRNRYKEIRQAIFFTLILILLLNTPTIAQKYQKFTLRVSNKSLLKIDLRLGESFFLEGYKAAKKEISKSTFGDTIFVFSGEILYPTAFRIFGGVDTLSINELLFIEPGSQSLEISLVNNELIINNRPSTRIENEYREFLKGIKEKNADVEIDKELFSNYVSHHKQSFVALYLIINQVFNYDLKPSSKTILAHFDKMIQKTKAYRYFQSQYFPSHKFIPLTLKDSASNQINIDPKKQKKNLLIEFWFTGCKPCYAKMKEIKETQFTDLSNIVDFLSINTDEEGVTEEACAVLNSMDLPWINLWDANAESFRKYGIIYKYPSNILIDAKGEIIGRDVDIKKLKEFLD
ncbi:TlpA disulfide reductase family protein [Parasegetibacter sp. NRK P23]|uniref:TlpA family protein disulfide reductase n=1 Tax=Parasegetibacter sp. NRK P23 TaxID=2942999 RepID=UPI0020440925|nr:TlpA disulfide reductase family protein [Parasegetibacter sp. NRK P23]MCM5527875.1 TlpA family protein disulfide reductase [Parasegetibacter sp. NRK P23]